MSEVGRSVTVSRRSFPVAAAILWNTLLVDVQSSPSLPVFHQCLKTFLFHKSFPDVVWQADYAFVDLVMAYRYFSHVKNFLIDWMIGSLRPHSVPGPQIYTLNTRCKSCMDACREAARVCRRKKKEYIACLEMRVMVLESQNRALIHEFKSLRELYSQYNHKPDSHAWQPDHWLPQLVMMLTLLHRQHLSLSDDDHTMWISTVSQATD